MLRKHILLRILFSVSMILIVTISGAQAPQTMDRPSGQRGGPGGSEEGKKDAQALLDQERQAPTVSVNVAERFRMLKTTISSFVNAGIPVRNILSRDDAEAIDALLRQGNTGEAAQRVHDAIMKLEQLPAGHPVTSQGPGAAGAGAQPRPAQERVLQANAPDVVGSAPLMRVNIHHLANRSSFGNVLKLTNPAIDPQRRRLYICGTKSTAIGVIDMNTDQLIETFDVGIDAPCGYLVFDQTSRKLFSQEMGGENRIIAIDVADGKAEMRSSLPTSIVLPRRQGAHKGATKTYKGLSYTDTGYPFDAGYLQGENASYGVIEIRDRNGRDVGTIKHGPDALYFDIDEQTGKLYASNTGDGSISVFDLGNGNRKIKDIDVGTSIDEVLLNPVTGGLFIRNRLGGSTLLSYDPRTGALATLPNENTAGAQGIGLWPTKMIYDNGKFYVLSHYDARIDIIDAATNKVIGRIPLKLSLKPRTDGISTMTMDTTRKILYAAFPELGEIAVADARAAKWLQTITIEGYDKSRINPARITLAVDEGRNRLLAYLSEEQTVNIYQGPSYTVERKTTIGGEQVRRLSLVNNERGVLYMGNRMVDLKTLEIKGVFPKGSRVIAFNNEKNRVYLSDFTPQGPRRVIERVYEYENLTLKKQWTLSSAMSIPSSFAFDFANNKFYVGYFEAAVVEAFDLASGEAPSAGPSSLKEKGDAPGPGNHPGGAGGRCGDGICQPVEREKGVCPDDCK